MTTTKHWQTAVEHSIHRGKVARAAVDNPDAQLACMYFDEDVTLLDHARLDLLCWDVWGFFCGREFRIQLVPTTSTTTTSSQPELP